VLLQIGQQLLQPFGGQGGPTPGPEPLPESEAYRVQTVYLPYEKVGAFWFGGDWYGGRRGADGSLWLIVADITGHGYAAHLLATSLPHVWHKVWASPRLLAPEPSDVLDGLHALLAACLPGDVYVECTLLRLEPDGRVTVAPAGGSRLLLRRRQEGRLDLVKLRGLWLGMDRPLPEDQRVYLLEAGDELMLGTDGVFDQLTELDG